MEITTLTKVLRKSGQLSTIRNVGDTLIFYGFQATITDDTGESPGIPLFPGEVTLGLGKGESCWESGPLWVTVREEETGLIYVQEKAD